MKPPPPVIVSAFGPAAAKLAARIGDGLFVSGAATDTVQQWRDAGGRGPVYAQLTLCWAADRDEAVTTAHRIWPNTGVPGQLSQELPAGLLQLGDVAPGIAAQVGSQGGRGADAAEQRGHRAVPQQAHVVDRIGAGGHARHQARHLHRGPHPLPPERAAEPGAMMP